jgi:hypothetical protein
MTDKTTSLPPTSTSQKALLLICWIGGVAALVLGLTVADGAARVVLAIVGIGVLVLAIILTAQRRRKAQEQHGVNVVNDAMAATRQQQQPVLTAEELKIRTALVNGRFREMQDDGSFPIEYHDIDTTDAARELAAQDGFLIVDGKLVLVDRVFADWQHTRGQN